MKGEETAGASLPFGQRPGFVSLTHGAHRLSVCAPVDLPAGTDQPEPPLQY
jgi:hypothetical protein